MDDRFKFRFWDNSTIPQMRYNVMVKTQGKLFNSLLEDAEEKNMIIMQCTGLKDKNGKLIYEGDILQYPSDKTRYKLHYETAKAYELYDITHKEKKDDVYFLFRHHDKVEIIGNIYKNPELLETI